MTARFCRLGSAALIPGLFLIAIFISVPNRGHSETGKAAASKDHVKELENRAKLCRTADEAQILYGIFMADEETTAEEREKAQPQLDYWNDAVKKELVRVGKKWIPKKEAEVLKADADKLVEEAVQSLQLEDLEGADMKLKKASVVYPEHLPSLYLLGLGACLNGKFDMGEKQFSLCLTRAPSNVALLNNAAVCEVKNKKYGEAIQHWEMAANLDPENPDIKYNLINFVSAATKHQLGKVDRKLIDRATALVAELKVTQTVEAVYLVRNEAAPPPPNLNPQNNMNPPNNMRTRETKPRHKPKAPTPQMAEGTGRVVVGPNAGFVISKLSHTKGAMVEESQIVGNGSGFVIAPGYVLTNRHVAAGAQSLSIQSPETGELLAAKVIAMGDPDLALIECKELKAPPVAIATIAPGRGTEVMALGFPLSSMVGKGLKTTRGIITGLPEKANKNMILLDVPVNPGNSGGPLCDQSGRIVGIVTAKTFSDTFIQGYGLAIPIEEAINFVRGTLRDWKPAAGTETKLEWPAVDASLSKSTVMVLIYKKR